MSVRSILLVLALAMSGCLLPYPIQEIPHIAGRVADAATKHPVAGATLQFERYQQRPAVTAADGRFDIPAISPVELYPVPLPDATGHGRDRYLLVSAPGYQEARLKYRLWRSHLDETILLKRR
jgi:hypothetical protein